ncbi:MAG: alcohol dehydrogenase catalytic domain-containing protein [Pseudomonadota bacterium]
MKQLTFLKADTFEWREVATPTINTSAQALVRPLAVTRCDLDLYIATGLYPLEGPFAFGHEIAGEVVDIGDAVGNVVPGDRVIVPFQISCGTCSNCRKGFTNACLSVPAFASYGLAPIGQSEWGGGLSDLLRVPFADAMLVKIPPELSLVDAAAMSDNAVDGYRTVAGPMREYPGSDVLVIGGLAQSVALYAVKAAIALGAKRVVYRDFDQRRLSVASALGAEAIATTYSASMAIEEQFDITVEGAGIPEALVFALRSTAPCGICTGVSAGIGTTAEIPLRAMYSKGITYQVSRVHARAALEELLMCDSCSKFQPHSLIDATLPFSSAIDAMGVDNTKTVFIADEIFAG